MRHLYSHTPSVEGSSQKRVWKDCKTEAREVWSGAASSEHGRTIALMEPRLACIRAAQDQASQHPSMGRIQELLPPTKEVWTTDDF